MESWCRWHQREGIMAKKAEKKEAEKKAAPVKEVVVEKKVVEKKVEECKGHSGPPCSIKNCPEWGRW